MSRIFVSKINDPAAYATEAEATPKYPVIVLDCSASMGSDFVDLRQFVLTFAETYTQFDLILFGCHVNTYTINTAEEANLSRRLEDLIVIKGTTNAAAAINQMWATVQQHIQAGKEVGVVWVNDGESDSHNDTLSAIQTAIAGFNTLTPDQQERLSIAAFNYSSRGDTRYGTQLAALGTGQFFQVERYSALGCKPSLSSEAIVGNILELFGAGQRQRVVFTLLETDDGLICTTPAIADGRAILTNAAMGFLHACNSAKLRFIVPTAELIQGHLIFIGDVPPIMELGQGQWRTLNENDTYLLRCISEQTRNLLTGLQLQGRFSPEQVTSVKAQIHTIYNAVEKSLLPESAAPAAAAADPVAAADSATLTARLKQQKADAKKRLTAALKPRTKTKKLTGIVAVMAELLNTVEEITKLSARDSLAVVNNAMFAARQGNVVQRANKMGELPIDIFIKAMADEKNLLEWLKALSAASKAGVSLDHKRQSMLSLCSADDVDDIKALVEAVDMTALTAEHVKDLYEGCIHACGLPLLMHQNLDPKDTELWGWKTNVQQLEGSITLSDAIGLGKDDKVPSQHGAKSVNATLLLPSMFIAAFFRQFNIDTIGAALQVRKNPEAMPKDAATLQAVGLHYLIRQLRKTNAVENPFHTTPYVGSMLQLIGLISYRNSKAAQKIADDAEAALPGAGKNTLAVEIRKLKPVEAITYLGLWPSINSKALKNIAHEVMMLVYYRNARYREEMKEALEETDKAFKKRVVRSLAKKHAHITMDSPLDDLIDLHPQQTMATPVDVALRYLLAKQLNSCAAKPFEVTCPKAGRVTDVSEKAQFKIVKIAPEGAESEFTVQLPYGATSTVSQGDKVIAGQNLITWPDSASGENLMRQAWIDHHLTASTMNEHLRKDYHLDEGLMTLLTLTDAELLDQFVADITQRKLTTDQYLAYATTQQSQKNREALPVRCQLMRYLMATPLLAADLDNLKKFQKLTADPALLEADIREKYTDSDGCLPVTSLEEAYDKYPAVENEYSVAVHFPENVAEPTWLDITKTKRMVKIEKIRFFAAYYPIILKRFTATNEVVAIQKLLGRLFLSTKNPMLCPAAKKSAKHQNLYMAALSTLTKRVIQENTAAAANEILLTLFTNLLSTKKGTHGTATLKVLMRIKAFAAEKMTEKDPIPGLITEYQKAGITLKVDWSELQEELDTAVKNCKVVDKNFLDTLSGLAIQFNDYFEKQYQKLEKKYDTLVESKDENMDEAKRAQNLQNWKHNTQKAFFKIIARGLMEDKVNPEELTSSVKQKMTDAQQLHDVIVTLRKAGVTEPAPIRMPHNKSDGKQMLIARKDRRLSPDGEKGKQRVWAINSCAGLFRAEPAAGADLEDYLTEYNQAASTFNAVPYLVRAYLNSKYSGLTGWSDYIQSNDYLALCAGETGTLSSANDAALVGGGATVTATP